MPMLKIIMICHIKIPHHEGFFVFHNLCSWALSLITTDRINLRNQHCIFFPSGLVLFTICSSVS